jgi:hypothetical protein
MEVGQLVLVIPTNKTGIIIKIDTMKSKPYFIGFGEEVGFWYRREDIT